MRLDFVCSDGICCSDLYMLIIPEGKYLPALKCIKSLLLERSFSRAMAL